MILFARSSYAELRRSAFIPVAIINIFLPSNASSAEYMPLLSGYSGSCGGTLMQKTPDRRSFLKIAGTSLGIGALYHVFPAASASAEARDLFHLLGRKTGEMV